MRGFGVTCASRTVFSAASPSAGQIGSSGTPHTAGGCARTRNSCPPEEVTVDNPLVLNQAFQYRLTGCIGPQKTGKGPTEASCAILEACGPVVFAGWAKLGDVYRCSDNGCPCGWVYHYNPGEPKGMRHPSPLIQLTANSEDQVRNAYRPLVAMIRLGPLKRLLKVREGFIRILRPGINLG